MRDDYHKLTERSTKALEHIAAELKGNLPAIEADLNLIARSLNDIVNILRAPKAIIAILTYSIGGNMPGNVLSGVVGNTATPLFAEAAADGSSVAPIGPVVFASDNPSVVSVDSGTGRATLVGAGTANVSAIDQGNNLTDSVAFTVSSAPPPPAVSASLSYTLDATIRRR